MHLTSMVDISSCLLLWPWAQTAPAFCNRSSAIRYALEQKVCCFVVPSSLHSAFALTVAPELVLAHPGLWCKRLFPPGRYHLWIEHRSFEFVFWRELSGICAWALHSVAVLRLCSAWTSSSSVLCIALAVLCSAWTSSSTVLGICSSQQLLGL